MGRVAHHLWWVVAETVKKLILVGSAVFDARSSSRIEGVRLQRLSEEKRQQYWNLRAQLEKAEPEQQDRILGEWADLLFDADVYDPLTRDLEVIDVQHKVHEKVWNDFAILRDKPGHLASEFRRITAPAVVIHGEFDPHPIEGIRPFLESCLSNVAFYILPKCGHYPWIERWATEEFYEILNGQIRVTRLQHAIARLASLDISCVLSTFLPAKVKL